MREQLKKHFKFGSDYRKYSEQEIAMALKDVPASVHVQVYNALIRMENYLLQA